MQGKEWRGAEDIRSKQMLLGRGVQVPIGQDGVSEPKNENRLCGCRS